MSEITLTAFNHPHYSGARWTAPLRASLEKIDESAMNRIVKVVLRCLAYLVFGIPALIGMRLNQRSIDRVEDICTTFKAELERLNGVFDNTFKGYESNLIDFEYDQKSTYDQNKYARIHMKRALTNAGIEQLVDGIRRFSYQGLFIDCIGIEASNQFDPIFLRIGHFQQSTFANVTLHVPDQFQFEGNPQQVIEIE